MNAARASNAYRKVDLDSAPKTEVLRRLFERFDQDVEAAKHAIAKRDIVAKAKAVDHALRIVNELEASLDHASAPELCANLAALYAFVTDRINTGNIRLDTAAFDQAAKVMRDLAVTFREAAAKR